MRVRAAVAAMIAVGVATICLADTPPPTQMTPAAAEKLKCKSYVVTGTIAVVRKECRTHADWERLALIGQQNASNFVGSVRSGSHENDDPK